MQPTTENLNEAIERVTTFMYEDPFCAELAHGIAAKLFGETQEYINYLMIAEAEMSLTPKETQLYNLYWGCLSQAYSMIATGVAQKQLPWVFSKQEGGEF